MLYQLSYTPRPADPYPHKKLEARELGEFRPAGRGLLVSRETKIGQENQAATSNGWISPER